MELPWKFVWGCSLLGVKYKGLRQKDVCIQRAKKVMSNSPRLVDFTIRQVNSVLNLPAWQVKFFREF